MDEVRAKGETHEATEKPMFRTRALGWGHVPAAAFLGLPDAVKVVTLSSDGFSGHSGSHITPLSSKPPAGLALSSNPLTPTPSKPPESCPSPPSLRGPTLFLRGFLKGALSPHSCRQPPLSLRLSSLRNRSVSFLISLRGSVGVQEASADLIS